GRPDPSGKARHRPGPADPGRAGGVSPARRRGAESASRLSPGPSAPEDREDDAARQVSMEDEQRLLAQAKKGNAPAFERLVTPYLPMLFAYSRAICLDYHAAQDVVQETAIIAFRNLNHLFPEADLPTWLMSIARRQPLAVLRKLHRFARLA